MNEDKKLLVDICRCPNIKDVLINNKENNPCFQTIKSQNKDYDNFQVPEPWSGDITRAKIVFLLCNPSISENENFPTHKNKNEELEDFFINRHNGDRPGKYINGDVVIYSNDKTKRIPTQSEIKQVAQHIFGKSCIPGKDYAQLEITHCKTLNKNALSPSSINECVSRHFFRTIELIKAKLIVSCGVNSLEAMNTKFDLKAKMHDLIGPVNFEKNNINSKYIAFIGQPGSSYKRTGSEAINGENLSKIRNLII
tara:strand:+ start:405 stop:1163 length:759 start_codon:yes stop_codon:yes gene_type:complete